MPPPPAKEFIKYEVGEVTVTEINLLDFDGPSPLATSQGWIDPEGNGINILADPDVPGLSVNGLPLTEDFDLAIYIKGDRKPTAIFDAQLVIEYDCPETINCDDLDEDGIANKMDNCIVHANPEQADTDEDGYGNACDADFNNDCIVNSLDLAEFSVQFFTAEPEFDLNNDGVVNFLDQGILSSLFMSAPGPSALTNDCDVE